MNAFFIGSEFYKAVAENNSAIVEEGVNEIQDKLLSLWDNSRDSSFEDFLDLGFQRLKRSRRDIPKWRESTVYQIGMLEGILSTFDRLLQEAKDRSAIDQNVKQTLRNSGPVAKKIFSKLFSLSETDEWIGHKELAISVETSDSSLSNIMKRLVIARAVDSERVGKNVNYRITPAGKRYYIEKLSKQRPEEMLDSVLVGFSQLSQKIDGLCEQFLNVPQSSIMAEHISPASTVFPSMGNDANNDNNQGKMISVFGGNVIESNTESPISLLNSSQRYMNIDVAPFLKAYLQPN